MPWVTAATGDRTWARFCSLRRTSAGARIDSVGSAGRATPLSLSRWELPRIATLMSRSWGLDGRLQRDGRTDRAWPSPDKRCGRVKTACDHRIASLSTATMAIYSVRAPAIAGQKPRRWIVRMRTQMYTTQAGSNQSRCLA